MLYGNRKNVMRALALPLSGLAAQKERIETIAMNLANAETVRGPNGEPYRRQVTVLQRAAGGGVEVSGVVEDQSPMTMEYQPGHPDADEDGWVMMPNVDPNTEIADMMIARRMFEANATAFDAAKAMLQRALDI